MTFASPAATHHSATLVDLNISGENVTAVRKVLTRVPGSKLARWVTGADPAPHDAQGRLFIDRDPASFRRLAQYRPGHLPPMSDVERARFAEDAAYLGLADFIADDLALDALRKQVAARGPDQNRPQRYALAERLEAAGQIAAGFELFDSTAREEGGYNNEAMERYGAAFGGYDEAWLRDGLHASKLTARDMRRCVHADRCVPVRTRVPMHYALSAEALRREPTHFESLLVRGMLLSHGPRPASFEGDDGSLGPALKAATAQASPEQVAALKPLFQVLDQHPRLEQGLHAAARTRPWQALAKAARTLIALHPTHRLLEPLEEDRGDKPYGKSKDARPQAERVARRTAGWCLRTSESLESVTLLRQAHAALPVSASVRFYVMQGLINHQVLQDCLTGQELFGAAGVAWLREALDLVDWSTPHLATCTHLGRSLEAFYSSKSLLTPEADGLLRALVTPLRRAAAQLAAQEPAQAEALVEILDAVDRRRPS